MKQLFLSLSLSIFAMQLHGMAKDGILDDLHRYRPIHSYCQLCKMDHAEKETGRVNQVLVTCYVHVKSSKKAIYKTLKFVSLEGFSTFDDVKKKIESSGLGKNYVLYGYFCNNGSRNYAQITDSSRFSDLDWAYYTVKLDLIFFDGEKPELASSTSEHLDSSL